MFLFNINELVSKNGTLQLCVKPNGRENRIIGTMANGSLKIELKAPAVNSKANKALLKFLSDVTNKPINFFKIISGYKSRIKLIQFL